MRHGGFSKPPSGAHVFPFLAVLICTMGSLVVCLVVISSRVRAHAVRDAQVRDATASQITQNDVEDQTWIAEQLVKSQAATAQDLATERARLSSVEAHLRELRQEVATINRSSQSLEDVESQKHASLAEMDDEIRRLSDLLAAANTRLVEEKENQHNLPPRFAIVPYVGPNQTRRRPIMIECTAVAVIIQPEGVVFDSEDFEGPLGPGNPLASAVRGAIEFYIQQSIAAGEKEDPYPLLLVRPDGVVAYHSARAALNSWKDEFGYELVGSDWRLDFPSGSPELKQVMLLAQRDGRVRQERAIRAAPREYSGQRRSLVDADESGGSGAPGYRGGGGSPGGHGSGGSGGTAYGGFASGAPTNGSGQGMGGPANGAGSGGGTGFVSGGARTGSSSLLGGGTGSGSGAVSGGSTGDGGSLDRGNGTGNNAMGGSLFGGNGSGSSTVGTGSAGSGSFLNNGGTSTESSGSNAGGSGVPTPDFSAAGGGTGSGQSSDGQAMGSAGGMPNSAAPAPPTSNTGSRITDDPFADGNKKPIGQSSKSNGGGFASHGPASASSSHESASHTSGRGSRHGGHAGFAMDDNGPSDSAITRPLAARLKADRIELLSEDGRVTKEINLGPSVTEAAEDLQAAVLQQVKGWGSPGKGSYWRPVLVFEYDAKSSARFAELRKQLSDDGIAVREKSLAKSPTDKVRK